MFCTSLQFHLFIVMPLLVLSNWLTPFFPVACASIALSCGVCMTAASQASVPGSRARFWSRPLIASLFFLQPLVRGWARYKHRLNFSRPTPVEFPSTPAKRLESGTLNFWSRHGVERYAFIAGIQERLQRLGWQWRSDSGWDDFDFRITNSRWTTAQLTTAHEDLSAGRKFIRCRISTRISWLTWLLLCGFTLACVLTVALSREIFPLAWFAFALLPFPALFVADAEAEQRSRIAILLEDIAAGMQLEEFSPDSDCASRCPPPSGA
jgi:hypothetical protein